jgi:hypothetical protein
MSPSAAADISRFAVNLGEGIESDMMEVKSGKEESVEFIVTVAVVVVVQHGVEGRGEVMFGIGSMLIYPGTEETGPITIPVSEVLGHGGVGEGGREFVGATGGVVGADGGTGRGGGAIEGRLVGSALVDHVSLDNMGYGNRVAELGRHGHGGEGKVGSSLKDCSVVAHGVVGRAGR